MKILILTSPDQWFIPYAQQLQEKLTSCDLLYDHDKITEVYIRQGQTQPKRLLLLFSKTVQNTITNKLYLENEKQQPSTEYLQLTKAFYL